MRALPVGVPSRCQDQVYITTDELFRHGFHNNEFDEIRCKLDSTENPRPFQKYQTLGPDTRLLVLVDPPVGGNSPH